MSDALRRRTALILITLLALAATPVAGQDNTPPTGGAGAPPPATAAHPPLRAEDVARLAALDAATGAALRQVLAEGSAAAIADAVDALRGQAQPHAAVDPRRLAGDWSCRMTKIGGLSAAVSYPPYRCVIGVADGGITFAKRTGSQRTSGMLRDEGAAWVYAGSSFVAGEAPLPYGAFPAEIDTAGTQTLPDVGVLEVLDDGHARILFPRPYRESVLNVLTLTR